MNAKNKGTTDLQSNQKTQVNNNIRELESQIRPYQMGVLTKVAAQIINKVIDIPQWNVRYVDLEFVLEMLLEMTRKLREEAEKGGK